jgi:hypothetical protein
VDADTGELDLLSHVAEMCQHVCDGILSSRKHIVRACTLMYKALVTLGRNQDTCP